MILLGSEMAYIKFLITETVINGELLALFSYRIESWDARMLGCS